MNLHGKLYAESPVYRGNAKKTLFTRDGDGKHRLISLAGEISGTAQSLMDAFIGHSKNGKNIGLLNQLWSRLYGGRMPDRLIQQIECTLQESSYPRDNLFDLRMGIKLDEDRWASDANANYKMETLFRNSVFDFTMNVNDATLKQGEHAAQLYYLLLELQEGRFWFGAGKSKGLGHFRLEMDLAVATPPKPPKLHPKANHLRLTLLFNALNPVLVGWNWGNVDPESPSFAAVEGRLLVEAMRSLPESIRQRLAMSLGGPILNPKNWKNKFVEQLPRVLAIWLQEQVGSEIVESWRLPVSELKKLSKGKYKLSKKLLERLETLTDTAFPTQKDAEAAITEIMAEKANMAKRVLKLLKQHQERQHLLRESVWNDVADILGLNASLEDSASARLKDKLETQLDNEKALTATLAPLCEKAFPRLEQQIDQQINLLQSDSWVDEEIAHRQAHLTLKRMLLDGTISERQWGDSRQVPQGIKAADWREFLDAHRRVEYRHVLNPKNLKKSIVNDENMIEFLRSYRSQTRQELSQPYNIDFRSGGAANREISRKYGKPYDTVFMRMLTWAPSSKEQGAWEIYIPGSTIKGAFRKRASQVLKTLIGESSKTTRLLNRLFGTQGQRGLIFFSDAYLVNPADPESSWCSMDGVKMDPKTGAPIETAKRDFLYAYGDQLAFQCHLNLQDIGSRDMEAFSLLSHMLQDFERGDIPLGGEKTSGFGWVQAHVQQLEWLTADPGGVSRTLFHNVPLTSHGIWQRCLLNTQAAIDALSSGQQAIPAEKKSSASVPRANAGFISHRAFGGYCGMLFVQAETLTPLTIQESGEPSFSESLQEGPVHGWDFFSMTPPDAGHRGDKRTYALPSKSLKGMLRHMYTIAGDSHKPSPDISRLNPADSLFGWVGAGQNQAIVGRVSVSFGPFNEPQLTWFKVPYPYGEWQYHNNKWSCKADGRAHKLLIKDSWRLFPHAPLAPNVSRLESFTPDTFQANYFRAILPGSQANFTIRFWNLEKQELQRLLWTVALETELAHKMGKHRYVGFGSLSLRILPESYLIDWAARYAGKSEADWQLSLQAEKWLDTSVISHYGSLRKALNAKQL
ncbi:MAG: hypothetical protein GY801_31895 [bacterium]|nr:hypothetical protein [bacterium]